MSAVVSPTTSSPTPNTNSLAGEGYKICKQQISDNIKAMDQLEVYTVSAVAALYTFAFSTKSEAAGWMALSIAPLVVVAAIIRTWALDAIIGTLSDYVEHVEGNSTSNIGFTTYFRSNKPPALKITRWAVWVGLLTITFSVALIGVCKDPFWVGDKSPAAIDSRSA